MNIQQKIINLLNFLLSKRRSGTTTLLQKIASENDVFVLVQNKLESDEFYDGKAIALSDLQKLDGMGYKPILIETSLLISLLRDVDNKITHLNQTNESYLKHLENIEKEISRFKNRERNTIL